MAIADADKLVIVDVGALGGLKQAWHSVEKDIIAVLFEPDGEQAKILSEQPSRFHQTIIANIALGAAPSRRKLNITKSIGCTSVLVPNIEFMSRYSVVPALEIIACEEIDITTYAHLHRIGQVPKPDLIKVDVQGFEYDVLLGFGDLLGECLAIELEAQLFPVYRGQKLLHEIITLLDSYGFSLRRITPVDHFDGDVVEVDAWFTVGPDRISGLNAVGRCKLAMIEREWGIAPRRRQFRRNQWENERAELGLKVR